MLLSQQLKQGIEHAYQEMMRHEKHALIPIHRSTIYDLLNSSDPDKRQAFKRLSIITARYTLPIWKTAQPDDKSPEYIIEIAEKIINDRESVVTANNEAGKAWERLEKLAAVDDENAISNGVFYAYVACYEALMEILGRDPFNDIVISEDDTDSDLDPWCSDTVLWAAAAYSGRIGDPDSDLKKRQTFWEWWLREAIPTAINISTGDL